MIRTSRRPFGPEDREILERYRQQALAPVSTDRKATFFGGVAGMVASVVLFAGLKLVEQTLLVPAMFGVVLLGVGIGWGIDRARERRLKQAQTVRADEKWAPVLAVGEVEVVTATVSGAVRNDDNEANTAWFLDVGDGKILCVWDWSDEVTEEVEVTFVPTQPPVPLQIRWTGKTIAPLRPKRRFKPRERQPEQCEVLEGTLEQLDTLLAPVPSKSPRARKAHPHPELADELERLGFFKLVDSDQVAEVKAELGAEVSDWFEAVGRSFEGDAERLAEGGVKDLLDDLRQAMAIEGFTVDAVQESYDAEEGYTVTVGRQPYTMWSATEARQSWELTVSRTADLVNGWFASAGSEERLYLLGGGEDGVFVLLTPAMLDALARSGALKKRDLPGKLASA